MKYTCDECGKEFESGWSDEEAIAEFRRDYPNYPVQESSIVCDDCYQRIMKAHTQ